MRRRSSRPSAAFIALCCVASGTYLINDIWDIGDDRKHWSKRDRPIASGRLSAATALIVALSIIPLGVLLGTLVSVKTGAMLGLCLAVTLCYTLRLKTVPFVDGLTLAALFTIRLGIGAVAANAPPSPWLFVFSMFPFASLSYAKRYTKIAGTIVRQDKEVNGREVSRDRRANGADRRPIERDRRRRDHGSVYPSRRLS